MYVLLRLADLLRLTNATFPLTPTHLTTLALADRAALLSSLYAGGGVWGCPLVVVRHVMDFFVYVATLLGAQALPAAIADAMCAFVDAKLAALPWMRALSLSNASLSSLA